MQHQAIYQIRDVPTAALVLMSGRKLHVIRDGQRVLFTCEPSEELNQLVSGYLNGTLQVSALAYAQDFERAKGLIRITKYGGQNATTK